MIFSYPKPRAIIAFVLLTLCLLSFTITDALVIEDPGVLESFFKNIQKLPNINNFMAEIRDVKLKENPLKSMSHERATANIFETKARTVSSTLQNDVFCAKVMSPTFMAAAQTVTFDAMGGQTYADLPCLRYVELQEPVTTFSVIAEFISDFNLRMQVSRLLCSLYYRPASAPQTNVCSSRCSAVLSLLNPDRTQDSPAQASDRAVLENFLWDSLLVGGFCEYAPFYTVDGTGACVGGVQDESQFRPADETYLVRASCMPYKGKMCANMVSSVYSSPTMGSMPGSDLMTDTSLEFRESLFGLASSVVTIAPRFPARCDIALAEYTCGRVMMPCYEVYFPLQDKRGVIHPIKYPMPQLLKFDRCENYAVACKQLITNMLEWLTDPEVATNFVPKCLANSSILAEFDCDGKQIAGTGIPWHPNSTTVDFGLGAVPVNEFTQASQPTAQGITFEPILSCPAPLVIPTNEETTYRLTNSNCALPCPSIIFDASDYKMVDIIILFMAILGTTCITFLLATFLCFKEKRRSSLVLPFLFVCTLTSFAILIGVLVLFTPSNSMAGRLCANNSDEASQTTYPACAAQGFIILFGMLSLCAWWSVSAFDLFLRIFVGYKVSKGSRQETWVHYGYYVWAWVIPLGLAIVAGATQSLGPDDLAMTYCFVHGRTNKYIPWITAYYPLMVYLAVGAASMSCTLFILCKATKSLKNTTGSKLKDTWKHYTSALIFIFVFFLLFLTVIIFRAVAYFSDSIWLDSATEFVQCLLVSAPIFGTNCGMKPKLAPNVGFWVFVQFVVAGCGFFSFLVYGLNANIYLLWAARLGFVFDIECCKRLGKNTSEANDRMMKSYIRPVEPSVHESKRTRSNGADSTTITNHTKSTTNSRTPGAMAWFPNSYNNYSYSGPRTHLGTTMSHHITVVGTYRKGMVNESFHVADEHELIDKEDPSYKESNNYRHNNHDMEMNVFGDIKEEYEDAMSHATYNSHRSNRRAKYTTSSIGSMDRDFFGAPSDSHSDLSPPFTFPCEPSFTEAELLVATSQDKLINLQHLSSIPAPTPSPTNSQTSSDSRYMQTLSEEALVAHAAQTEEYARRPAEINVHRNNLDVLDDDLDLDDGMTMSMNCSDDEDMHMPYYHN